MEELKLKMVTTERFSEDPKINEMLVKKVMKNMIDDGKKVVIVFINMEKGRKYFWRTEHRKGMGFIPWES